MNNPRVRVTVDGGMANAPQILKLIKKITRSFIISADTSHNSSQDNYLSLIHI